MKCLKGFVNYDVVPRALSIAESGMNLADD